MSEKTVDRWWGLYRKEGWEGLHVKSRKPHTIYRTPEGTVEAVLELRRTRNWGPCKIEGYLRNYGIGVAPISHRTIYKILVQTGLNNPIEAPRKTWGRRRFERPYSNNLWQSDYKMTETDEWMISYLDDHSRYVPGSEIHYNPTGEHAIHLLEDCIHQYGKPDQILTDQGTQYHPARGDLSAFTEFWTGKGIEHIMGSIGKPTTQGKIERFFQTFELYYPRFNDMTQFLKHYNNVRPHRSLNFFTSAEVYYPSLVQNIGPVQ